MVRIPEGLARSDGPSHLRTQTSWLQSMNEAVAQSDASLINWCDLHNADDGTFPLHGTVQSMAVTGGRLAKQIEIDLLLMIFWETVVELKVICEYDLSSYFGYFESIYSLLRYDQ